MWYLIFLFNDLGHSFWPLIATMDCMFQKLKLFCGKVSHVSLRMFPPSPHAHRNHNVITQGMPTWFLPPRRSNIIHPACNNIFLCSYCDFNFMHSILCGNTLLSWSKSLNQSLTIFLVDGLILDKRKLVMRSLTSAKIRNFNF